MKRNLRLPVWVLTFLFLFTLIPIRSAAATAPQPDLSHAQAICIYHIASGRTIVSKNENASLPAGSLPKVMAGLIACEIFADVPDRPVDITAGMISGSTGRCSGILKKGTDAQPVYTITAEQLLYLALCGSYNDAYDVLAIVISGSREAFAERMNQRAGELGAGQTRFADPSGVRDDSVTTAADMIRIASAAYRNDAYLRISSAVRCDLFSDTFYNPNAFLSAENALPEQERGRYVDGRFRGMSAGETTKAGHCLATVAREGNSDYLCVVLGGEALIEESGRSSTYSYLLPIRLINWIGENYTYRQILDPEKPVCQVPVTKTDLKESVDVVTKESLFCFLPIDAEVGGRVSLSIRLAYDSLEAPVEPGTKVGYVTVLYEGQTLGTAGLYTAESVERSRVSNRLLWIRDLTSGRRVRASMICFAVCTALWIGIEVGILFARRHKWDKYFTQKLEAPEELARRERRKKKNGK